MRFCDMDLVMWMRCEGSSIEFHMYGVVFGWYVSCVCVLVCGRGGGEVGYMCAGVGQHCVFVFAHHCVICYTQR